MWVMVIGGNPTLSKDDCLIALLTDDAHPNCIVLIIPCLDYVDEMLETDSEETIMVIPCILLIAIAILRIDPCALAFRRNSCLFERMNSTLREMVIIEFADRTATASRVCGHPRIPSQLSLELNTIGRAFSTIGDCCFKAVALHVRLVEDIFKYLSATPQSDIPLSSTPGRLGFPSPYVCPWLTGFKLTSIGRTDFSSPLLTFRVDGSIACVRSSWTLVACALFCEVLSVSNGFVPEQVVA
jgi:hypothetical protein